jgi:hypothetical protein
MSKQFTIADTLEHALNYQTPPMCIGRKVIVSLREKLELMRELLSGIEDLEKEISTQVWLIENHGKGHAQFKTECEYRINLLRQQMRVKGIEYKKLLQEVAI